MKPSHPSPAFPTRDYVRPNLDWECGHLCEGCPCRIGPSPTGECRATFECEPRFEAAPDGSSGRWTCTRPRTAGGKCANGPLPDGTCCNAIPKCQPRRTLRSIRKRVTVFTLIASLLILCLGLSRNLRDAFINPGPLSHVHASTAFSNLHKKQSGDNSGNCAACHPAAAKSTTSWHESAIDAIQHGLTPAEMVRDGPLAPSAMDTKCLACHQGKDFHQPEMTRGFACQECHKEHQGGGFMPKTDSKSCTSCHGSRERLASSSRTATHNPQPITAFESDHPEFRLIRNHSRDETPLKFNHEIHLRTGKIPRVLKCDECHERDARGEYQRPVNYNDHCAECHTLQFDPYTTGNKNKPGIQLPHGDPYHVRAYLRSLNIQYEEYARSHEGITRRDELNEYVREKKVGIEKLYETGENLERAVFFADMKGNLPGGRKAPFAGCATCHEVAEPANDSASPTISKVTIPDRWLTQGSFNHDMHRKGLTCLDCHKVTDSKLTSDINLPSIKSCQECHSPSGGIDHRCTQCHSYHNPSR